MAGDPKAQAAVLKAFEHGVLNYREHYQLVNPSEYWAVNGSRILGQRYNAVTWTQKARQWLREMVAKIKGLLRLPSDAPILRALNYLLDVGNFGVERGGKFRSPSMLMDTDRPFSNIGSAIDRATTATNAARHAHDPPRPIATQAGW